MRVTIIGCGYVGLITGVCLAYKEHEVVCVDRDQSKIDALNKASCPIHETGLASYLQKVVGRTFKASSDLQGTVKDSDIIMVAVGTPYCNDNIDLTDIESAVSEIGICLRTINHYVTVAIKSTVIPGTIDSLVIPLLEKQSGKCEGRDFSVCMNPEFLREGNAIADCMSGDRIVIGTSHQRCHDMMSRLYRDFNADIVRTTAGNAEMIKYTSNALLATLISFSNEMANICARVEGLDIMEVMRGVHLDHRLNPIVNGKRLEPEILHYILPSSGFGGSCFPKDLKAIIKYGEAIGAQTELLKSVVRINDQQPLEILRLIKSIYPRLGGIKVAVLGLAFKPGTDDIRESSAIRIINILQKHEAIISAYDPIVTKLPGLQFQDIGIATSWRKALKGADVAILATPWDVFQSISQDDYRRLMKRPVIIDARRLYDCRQFADVNYLGTGFCGNTDLE